MVSKSLLACLCVLGFCEIASADAAPTTVIEFRGACAVDTFRPGADESKSWRENQGESLYNGIRLPEIWPPTDIDPRSTESMPVPYLEFPPEVIPVAVGRQLLVDDFLIENTDLERRFHKPVKYAGNPILKPETELELNRAGNAIACPKSGGLWWNPALQRFQLWYEAGWINTICYATSRDGLDWDRPNLDIQPGTNRVLPPGINSDSWTVVLDYWASDPRQRYKMFLRPPGGANHPDPKFNIDHGYSLISADRALLALPTQWAARRWRRNCG